MKFALPQTQLKERISNCEACGLNKSSKIPVYGSGGMGLLIVFDGQDSLQQQVKSFGIGFRFEFVRRALKELGIDITHDCWVTSLIQCYSNDYTNQQGSYCLANLHSALDTLKPKVVLFFGEACPRAVLKDTIKGIYLDMVRGIVHNSRMFGCRMVFTLSPFHPASQSEEAVIKVIHRDIAIAANCLARPYKQYKAEEDCIELLNPRNAALWLEREAGHTQTRWQAFDYETNSLRPYNYNAEIVSCAIADSADHAVAFMMNDMVVSPLNRWLKSRYIKKIAHNTAFERTWSIAKQGVEPEMLIADTMLLFHAMDNRKDKVRSIKFLGPMLTGCQIWNEHIEGYFESDTEGSYGINKIRQIPQRQLLIYNAMDSLIEFRVFNVLMEQLKDYEKTFALAKELKKERDQQ